MEVFTHVQTLAAARLAGDPENTGGVGWGGVRMGVERVVLPPSDDHFVVVKETKNRLSWS